MVEDLPFQLDRSQKTRKIDKKVGNLFDLTIFEKQSFCRWPGKKSKPHFKDDNFGRRQEKQLSENIKASLWIKASFTVGRGFL